MFCFSEFLILYLYLAPHRAGWPQANCPQERWQMDAANLSCHNSEVWAWVELSDWRIPELYHHCHLQSSAGSAETESFCWKKWLLLFLVNQLTELCPSSRAELSPVALVPNGPANEGEAGRQADRHTDNHSLPHHPVKILTPRSSQKNRAHIFLLLSYYS